MRQVVIKDVTEEEKQQGYALDSQAYWSTTDSTRWTSPALPKRPRSKTYQKKKPFDALRRGLHIAIELAINDAYDRLGRIKNLSGTPIEGSSMDQLIEYALTNNIAPVGVLDFAKQLKRSGIDINAWLFNQELIEQIKNLAEFQEIPKNVNQETQTEVNEISTQTEPISVNKENVETQTPMHYDSVFTQTEAPLPKEAITQTMPQNVDSRHTQTIQSEPVDSETQTQITPQKEVSTLTLRPVSKYTQTIDSKTTSIGSQINPIKRSKGTMWRGENYYASTQTETPHTNRETQTYIEPIIEEPSSPIHDQQFNYVIPPPLIALPTSYTFPMLLPPPTHESLPEPPPLRQITYEPSNFRGKRQYGNYKNDNTVTKQRKVVQEPLPEPPPLPQLTNEPNTSGIRSKRPQYVIYEKGDIPEKRRKVIKEGEPWAIPEGAETWSVSESDDDELE